MELHLTAAGQMLHVGRARGSSARSLLVPFMLLCRVSILMVIVVDGGGDRCRRVIIGSHSACRCVGVGRRWGVTVCHGEEIQREIANGQRKRKKKSREETNVDKRQG